MGSFAINMFSNSKKSEFDPREGVSIQIHKILNYLGEGGGVRSNLEFSQKKFRIKIVMPSLT